MPVVEYKLIRNRDGSRSAPPEIVSGGYEGNSLNFTMLGWVDDITEYVVSNTFKVLNRQQVIDRALALHAVQPYMIIDPTGPDSTQMSEAEVTTYVGDWYDNFVSEMRSRIDVSDFDITEVKKQKITEAFTELQNQLENMTVEAPIASAGANCQFGCDDITLRNVEGVNIAASRGVKGASDTVKWAPKGYLDPIDVTMDEMKTVGSLLLDRKTAAYNQYFVHKKAIMNEANTEVLIKYDYTTGY